MKKLLFLLFAAFLLTGNVAHSASIAEAVDPQSGGPEVWTDSVYNNSGSTLSVGDLVVWQVGSSTGDNDNYVTTSSTANTALVAGIVWPVSIAAGSSGTIAIRGSVPATVGPGGVVDGNLLCQSSTSARIGSCTTTASEAYRVGYATAGVQGGGTAQVYLFGNN